MPVRGHWVGAGLLAAFAGFAAAWPASSAPPFPGGEEAMAAAARGLEDAGPGYVLMLGDSNAAAVRQGDLPCRGRLVNLGIGGVRAGQYADLLRAVRLPDGGALAVVNVGTGDIVRKLDPSMPSALDAYDAALSAIVSRAAPHVARVVVAALPPLAGRFAEKLDVDMVETYSKRAKAVCARLGCTYADPWAPIRDGAFGSMWPSASRDGLHPEDPGQFYARVLGDACARP